MNNIYAAIKAEVEEHVDEHAHGEFSLDALFEVMFGLDHVISEIFWNVAFLAVGYILSRIFAWRKIHKYIDDKHGVEHQDGKY